MASTLTNLLYHIVFSTKNREPIITAPIRESLYKYIGGIIRAEGGFCLKSAACRIMFISSCDLSRSHPLRR
jgi:REP element-mobilizing transposase RayT